jgi:cysteinyl-tRNA synthetase
MSLKIYNTLTRSKALFEPINPKHVGLYVCGPTVYSDVHLGNCRTFMSFDIIYRYLLHLGYQVRYVRNITDAGHLEGDRDEGDDKFSKKARLEQLEPMEIVQRYTVGFRDVMKQLNNLPPTIEPTATGHITEQIEMAKKLLANGFAYEVDGTIYFDVQKYDAQKPYGILTNRNLEDLLEGTRALGGQDEKRGRLDFALWIKAKPEHLMQWPSPWGMGFPGWHIECSAMSAKYLGNQFDIHGGGMDLAATHHTNEIAQSQACNNTSPAKIWMHTNMLTVNGARMSKSAGNGFLPQELFTGSHPLLEKPYHPMIVRFFMLQTHYRSTLDFSNEALQASEKAFKRLWTTYENLLQLPTTHTSVSTNIELEEKIKTSLLNFDADMNDDFNTAKVLANMFDLTGTINGLKDGIIKIEEVTSTTIELMKKYFKNYLEDVFGLLPINDTNNGTLNSVMQVLIDIRQQAKAKKDFATSDKIRLQLAETGVLIKDEKDGSTNWSIV